METEDCKLGKCQVCNISKAIYKCPACSFCTCSLNCVKLHKEQQYCNGERNKVAMVQRYEMNNLTILNDYRFLEEVDHKLEGCSRLPHRKAIVRGREMHSNLPPHLQKLIWEARDRNVVLTLMPQHFSMHQENSTRFSYADKKIKWHVKWVFPQADLTFVDQSVDEDSTIQSLIRRYIEPPYYLEPGEAPPNLTEEQAEKLSFYHSASYGGIAVLFQSSHCNNDQRYIEVRLSKSLRFNLSKRKVVEYPTFYVVLRHHIDAYVDSEDEMEVEEDLKRPNEDDLPQDESHKKLCSSIERVKLKDGGLSFFNYNSDQSDSDNDVT